MQCLPSKLELIRVWCSLFCCVCVLVFIVEFYTMLASSSLRSPFPLRGKKKNKGKPPVSAAAAGAPSSGDGGDALQGAQHLASGDGASGGDQHLGDAGSNDAGQQNRGSAAGDAPGVLVTDVWRIFEDRLATANTDQSPFAHTCTVVEALMVMFPPTGARRAVSAVDESVRIAFSSATAGARKSAYDSFLTDCPTGNFADFIGEVMRGENEHFMWSDPDSPESDSESEPSPDEEEPSPKRVRTSSSPTCKFSFDDYVRMAKDSGDMLLPCIEDSCSALRKDHAKSVSESSWKMPSRDNFPTFRDPKDKLMEDPYEFLAQLERQLKLHNVPPSRYGVVLIACLRDRIQQEWVETNIVATCQSWDDMKKRFKEKYDDPQLKNRLMLQLEKCVQGLPERVYEYTERYQSLVVRISAGAPIDTQMNIIMCERGFIPELRTELSKFRSLKSQELGRPFEFNSLAELYQAAATLETGLAPRAGRVSRSADGRDNRSTTRKRTRSARLNNVESKVASQSSAAATVAKIEMVNGKPVNMNKKHRSRKSTGGGTGGAKAAGGGGGGQQRRASTGSVPASTSGASAGPSRNAATSGPPGAAAGAAKPFTGTCFKCGKTGHRIADCRSK